MQILKFTLALSAALAFLPSAGAQSLRCGVAAPLFTALERGDTKTLSDYGRHRCSLQLRNSAGFTLYDVATLEEKTTMATWLVQHHVFREGQYSPAMLRLVQTGLRFLDFDAGVIDGTMNTATHEGIRQYQRAHGLRQTGELSPSWAAHFYRELTTKMQKQLSDLGFDTGTPDGIMGEKTRTAMEAFRSETRLPQREDDFIDDRFIYQVMVSENEEHKQEMRRRAELRIARLREQRAQQRRQQTGSTRSAPTRQPVAARPTPAAAPKTAPILIVKQRQPAAEATPAMTPAPERKPIVPEKQAEAPSQDVEIVKSNPRTSGVSVQNSAFQRISGTLHYAGSAQSCAIAGHQISGNWCATYYPSGEGKTCNAIVSSSGIMVSLLCK